MSAAVDVHAQLASIMERFVKVALVEMSRLIDKDSALLRAEVSRREMEVEALLCKLQFAETELRSARQAAAQRPPAPTRRSVAVQVNHTPPDRLSEPQQDYASALSAGLKEDGAERFHVKEEQTELNTWDVRHDGHENNIRMEDVQRSPILSEEAFHEAKPDIIWDSPGVQDFGLNPIQRSEAPQNISDPNPDPHDTDISPDPREDHTVQYQPSADCEASTQRRPGGYGNSAMHPTCGEQRGDGVGTGEKSSQCGHCGKTFTTRFYLKIHQRIHTGERPYTCMQCGKRFYCNSHLISHQRCHTGEKPYSCEECGKSYSHLNSLKLHQRSHTDGEVYNYW